GVRVTRPGDGGGQRFERLPDVVGRPETGENVSGQIHRIDLRVPQVVDVGRRTVRRQPAHDLGRLHQRVVAPEGHRTVPGRPADAQPAPGQTLLAYVDRDGAI